LVKLNLNLKTKNNSGGNKTPENDPIIMKREKHFEFEWESRLLAEKKMITKYNE